MTSFNKRRLQDIRRVRRCKDDRALLEGLHLLIDARSSGMHLDLVLVTPDAMQEQAIGESLKGLECTIFTVPEKILGKLTDSRSPTGIATIVNLPRPALSTIPPETGIWLYLDGIQDPGNLGSLARAAEGAGAKAICLGPGSAHPNHPRALRASAGSLLRMSVCRHVQIGDLDAHLDGRPWLGLEAHGGIDPFESPLPPSAVLAVGAEGPGLSPEARNRIDQGLSISLAGSLESLNATVATALVLFELRRQRARGPDIRPALP